jgi:hypothetical protein
MEALSKIISVTVDSGHLSCFFVASRLLVVNISYLLFVDDTLVFCEANHSHLCYLRVLLLCFEVVSVLKFNLAKSLLGCRTSSLPLKYLGMPLGKLEKVVFVQGWQGKRTCIKISFINIRFYNCSV